MPKHDAAAGGARLDVRQIRPRRERQTVGMRSLLVGLSLALAASAAAQPQRSALDRAYDELVAAHAVLQQAQAAREAGVEPQAGERIGTAGGHSRLSEGYWERQKQLEAGVELARRRLDEAVARWNAVR
jgi:hypothetical protein